MTESIKEALENLAFRIHELGMEEADEELIDMSLGVIGLTAKE